MQTLPQVGENAFVTGISFPLVIESYSEATRTASLKGEHPDTGMQVLLPQVCFDLLHADKPMSKGDLVMLKSGSPLLVVACANEEYASNLDLIGWSEGTEQPVIITNVSPACLKLR